MKKPFISPKLDIIRIKNGDVIMHSTDLGCIAENLFCEDEHSCGSYEPPGT